MLVWAYQGLPFRHQKTIKKSCFFRTLAAHPLFQFYIDVIGNGRFGDPLKIQRAQKWDPKSTKWRQIVKESMSVSGSGGFCCSRPAFPETIVITAPCGPSGFLKVICSMEIGSFSVAYVFMCAICYTKRLSL